ncbi:MAG TPA: hypothetical protein VN260_08245, partial [Dissulfurispiraceae bacterium]|nr:hypothetical protein [Dissulfurispiraceae bacterium]
MTAPGGFSSWPVRRGCEAAADHREPTAGETTCVIEAGEPEKHYWSDLWRYRELLCFLTWRDILVRYKQTAIGVAWILV